MKFELTTDTITHFGRTLYRIRALISFGDVTAGEIGGYVERMDNLAQDDNAWVYGNARVSPIVISGLRWAITITDHEMTIGCETHPIVEWASFYNKRINAMDRHALQFWRKHKDAIFAIASVAGRPLEAA